MARGILSGENLQGVWAWASTSTLVLSVTLLAATAGQAQTSMPDVTVNGCVVRQPDSIPAPPVGHEQEAARGLSLTQVTMRTVSEPQSFWLVGDKAIELARFVDRQAEVLGRFDERNPNPGGADAGAVPERRSTAAPPPRPDPAHPTSPTRILRVVSFRVLQQSCR